MVHTVRSDFVSARAGGKVEEYAVTRRGDGRHKRRVKGVVSLVWLRTKQLGFELLTARQALTLTWRQRHSATRVAHGSMRSAAICQLCGAFKGRQLRGCSIAGRTVEDLATLVDRQKGGGDNASGKGLQSGREARGRRPTGVLCLLRWMLVAFG